jgi:copper chaperone CopZ
MSSNIIAARNQRAREEESLNMTTNQATTLNIPGMSCQHCVQTITGVLTALPNTQDIWVDLASQTANLTHDPETLPLATIETALASAGYPVAKQSAPKRGKTLPLF